MKPITKVEILYFFRNALKSSIEDKRTSLEEALCAMKPEAHEKLQQKKEIEREIESVSAEINKR